MELNRTLVSVGTHGEGHPTKILLSGIPHFHGKTMEEKRQHIQQHYDFLRLALCREPRGHNDQSAAVVTAPVVTAEQGRSRDNPVPATFVSRRLLNKTGSEKETWHIDFDLSGCGLDYVVGDSFGIFARNDLGHVDQIIALIGALHTTPIRGKTLREVLTDDVTHAVDRQR